MGDLAGCQGMSLNWWYVCAVNRGDAEWYGTNRDSADSLSRCPSVFLAADIKGNKSAQQLYLWFVKVLEEAFKYTIQAVDRDQWMKQL